MMSWKNYKAKAEHYIRQHQDNPAIAKLKTNQPLTQSDIEALEETLWHEVGTKQDYEQEFGAKPLGEFSPRDRGPGYERRQGGVFSLFDGCESGQPADLLCKSDCGIHCPQWNDEGFFRASGTAVHRSGKRG